MLFSDRLELKDYLLIPLALIAIAVAVINLMGRGRSSILNILATIPFDEFSLSIVALTLTAGSALYVLAKRGEGGGFALLGERSSMPSSLRSISGFHLEKSESLVGLGKE